MTIMSNYGSDNDIDHDDDDDDYDNYDDENEESDDDQDVKESANILKYTSDGLNETKYKKLNVAHVLDLVKAECCHNYFAADAYAHQIKYKLSIQGINMCIHCFVCFNLHKFADCKNLSIQEEECLRFYIEKFTDDHASETCTRNKIYGKCLLCESKVGIKPKIFKKLDEIEIIESNHGNDANNITTTDIIMINKTDSTDFILVL